MSMHDQWLLLGPLALLGFVVMGIIVPGGGLIFGFFGGVYVTHALHMAFPSFAAGKSEADED